MKSKSYFKVIYYISFYLLIFDTIIGLVQLIIIVQKGGELLNSTKGQFRFTNLFIDLIVLIAMSLFLLNIWRKLFVEGGEEPIVRYKKLFIILSMTGGILMLLSIVLLANPFIMDIDLNRSPIGHVHDVLIKVGLIFFLIGIGGVILGKLSVYRNEK